MSLKQRFFLTTLSFFVFFNVFSTVSFASNTTPFLTSNNTEVYSYTINYSARDSFTIPTNVSLPYSPEHTSVVRLSSFADGLFDLMGTSDIVNNRFYIFSAYPSSMDLSMKFLDGSTYHTDTLKSSDFKGVAWFNSDTSNTFGLPYFPSDTPVVRGFGSYSDFLDTVMYCKYVPTIYSSSKDPGATVNFTWTWTVKISVAGYITLGDINSSILDQNRDITVELDELTQEVKLQGENITSSVDSLKQQDANFRNQDIDSANSVQSQTTSFVNDTSSTVSQKWKILFYPIEFTNSLLTAFTGGTNSRSYSTKYTNVGGYTYDEFSGALVPIIDLSRSVSSSGTVVTFPSFTLPVLNLKLWDSYSYDLSALKIQFPVLFDALYVVSGCVELFAFVSFLRSKYYDVFGG